MLHARGDVSIWKFSVVQPKEYAPRTWRCFYLYFSRKHCERVCSTHVEMFLPGLMLTRTLNRLLHARGVFSCFLNGLISLSGLSFLV